MCCRSCFSWNRVSANSGVSAVSGLKVRGFPPFPHTGPPATGLCRWDGKGAERMGHGAGSREASLFSGGNRNRLGPCKRLIGLELLGFPVLHGSLGNFNQILIVCGAVDFIHCIAECAFGSCHRISSMDRARRFGRTKRGLILCGTRSACACLLRAWTEDGFVDSHPRREGRGTPAWGQKNRNATRVVHPHSSRSEQVLAGLDVLHAPEAQAGPVLVDGHGAHGVESQRLQSIPAGIAIEVALVALR